MDLGAWCVMQWCGFVQEMQEGSSGRDVEWEIIKVTLYFSSAGYAVCTPDQWRT